MYVRARSAILALSLLLLACRPRADSYEDAGPAALASSDESPAKKPPPLRAAHLATPALPDLPTLDAHPPPGSAPADAHLEDHPCRAVWTGTQAAPLACAQSLLFEADHGKGAQVIVPRDRLHADPSTLPALVDHRLDGTEGPVRDQGRVPACTAFATAAALDHALARWGGGNPTVSVMQIWSRYHSPYVETSLSSNVGEPFGAEKEWPFRAGEAITWIACKELTKPPKEGCGKPVDDARARAVSAASIGEFTEVEYLGTAADPRVLQAKIAAGQDIVVTMELPATFEPRGKAGARYVPHYTKSAGADAGHALVLTGYARLPHGAYFLMHNSWGAGWGDGGYAWLHEATLREWAREMVAIDAEPLERATGSRPRRRRAETTCAGNLVVDSIRGTCAPACPDHSPRHDGICPTAGQCPAGYVNLTGACVLAAPTQAGKDPSTGVSWSCGPGGCSYEVPRSSDPACSGSICRASCPAPDYLLAKMGDALVCVE